LKRGTKPKPVNLMEFEGNPGKRALNKNEPKFKGGATCPPWMLPEAKREWKRLSPELERLELLTVADQAAFAAYCHFWAVFGMAAKIIKGRAPASIIEIGDKAIKVQDAGGLTITTEKGNVIQHPAVGIANQACKQMLNFATQFGFSPSARRALVTDKNDGSQTSLDFEDWRKQNKSVS